MKVVPDQLGKYVAVITMSLLLLANAGCGTVVYRIDDESDLARVNLTANDGLIVARIYTDFSGVRTAPAIALPESVVFEFKKLDANAFAAPEELVKFANWDPLVVIKVPAGTYRWEALRFRWLTYATGLEGSTFDVRPGSFNYVGDLSIEVFEDENGDYFATVSSKDDFSDIPAILHTAFPRSADDLPLFSAVSEVVLSSVR